MKKKTIDIIVRLLFLMCLAIFFTPPSTFYPLNIIVLPAFIIFSLFGCIWCAYRSNKSVINIIFLILYILMLILFGMAGN